MQYYSDNSNQYLNLFNFPYNGGGTSTADGYRSLLDYGTKIGPSAYQYGQVPAPAQGTTFPMSSHDASPILADTNYATNSAGALLHAASTVRVQRNMRVKKIKAPVQPTFCNICQVTLNSPSQADAHFKGQQHKKAANKDKTPGASPNAKVPQSGKSDEVVPADDAKASQRSDDAARSGTVQNLGGKTFTSAFPEVTMFVSPPISTTTPSVDGNEDEGNDPLFVVDSCEEGSQAEPRQKRRKVVTSIPCEVCSLTFNSESQAAAHFVGSRHLKKIKSLRQTFAESQPSQFPGVTVAPDPTRKWRFHCSICNVMSNSSVQFNQHCTGHGHARKVHEYSDPKNEVQGNKSGWFHCMTCNVSCRTALGLQTHVTSEHHKEMSQMKKDLTKVNAILGKDGH